MIGSNLLKRSTGCYVFIDIKKAFDSVPHQTLLNKLSSLNIPLSFTGGLLTIYVQGCNVLSLVVPSPCGSQLSQMFLRGLSWGPCFFCPTLTTWPLSLSLMAHEYCYLLMALCFIKRYLTTRILSISRQMWILLQTGPNSITWN